MSSNWDGQGQYQGAAQSTPQAAQDNRRVPGLDGRSCVSGAQEALDKFDAALGRRGREALDAALVGMLSGVPAGPVHDALYGSLFELAERLLVEERARLVAKLVEWAQRA